MSSTPVSTTAKINYIHAKDAKRTMVTANKPVTFNTTSSSTITRSFIKLSVPDQPHVQDAFIQLSIPSEAFLTRKQEDKQNTKVVTMLHVIISNPDDLNGLKELDIGVRSALAPHWQELNEPAPIDDRTRIRGTFYYPIDEKTKKIKEGAKPMMSLKLNDRTVFTRVYSDSVDQNGVPIAKTIEIEPKDYTTLLKKKLKCCIVFNLRDICPSPKGLSTQLFVARCFIMKIEQNTAPNISIDGNQELSNYLRINQADPLVIADMTATSSNTDNYNDDDDSDFSQSKIAKSAPPPALTFGNKMVVPEVNQVTQQMQQLNMASEQQQQQLLQQQQYYQQMQQQQQYYQQQQQPVQQPQQDGTWQQQQYNLGQPQVADISQFLPAPGQLSVTMQKL